MGKRKHGVVFALAHDRSREFTLPYCRQCGKVAHKSRRTAKAHLKTLRGSTGYSGVVYRCRKGGSCWHVGESKPKLLHAFLMALKELAGLE